MSWFPEIEKYVVSFEIGDKTGNPHWQGTIIFKHAHTKSAMIELGLGWNWSYTRKLINSVDYCIGAGKSSHQAGPWFFGVDFVPDSPDFVPRRWQQFVLDIVDGPVDQRKVYWFWENTGNFGKTWLSKFLERSRGACVIRGGGAGRDIAFILKDSCKKGNTVIFDVPRTGVTKVPIAILECIKDGSLTSTKYEGKALIFEPKHVLVFANDPPSESQVLRLSKDRWVVWELNDLVLELEAKASIEDDDIELMASRTSSSATPASTDGPSGSADSSAPDQGPAHPQPPP